MWASSLKYLCLASTVLWAAAGCGDDGDQRSYENSCDAACARAHECNSNVDVESCASDCRDDAADIGPQLSGSFLAALDACVAEQTCPQLALMPAVQGCQREAAAQLAPTQAARDLCDAIVASLQMCLGISVGTAGCLESVKIFSDSALVSARACAAMSCDQRTGCLQTELGTNPTATMMP
jgi:hypothetical protein